MKHNRNKSTEELIKEGADNDIVRPENETSENEGCLNIFFSVLSILADLFFWDD
jgi:hypothetical protein